MRRIAMLALAITMAGCSTDSTGPFGSVSGTYMLERINGDRLPYTFSNGVTLISDELTLFRDGTYEDVSRYASGSPRVERGYYEDDDGAIFLQPEFSNEEYQGSVNGRVLTLFVNGYTQTFERR